MKKTLTLEQRDQLKARLLARQSELQAQMDDNRADLTPPSADEGAMLQRNVQREVRQAMTDADTAELARIGKALQAIDHDDYGICQTCGKFIGFERLLAEPMTSRCVSCKSAAEQQAQRLM